MSSDSLLKSKKCCSEKKVDQRLKQLQETSTAKSSKNELQEQKSKRGGTEVVFSKNKVALSQDTVIRTIEVIVARG